MAQGRITIIRGRDSKPPPQKPDNGPTVFRIVALFVFIAACMWLFDIRIS